MQIFIYQLAPTTLSEDFQAKTADSNKRLNSWGKSNEICTLKTVLDFKLGNGEVDDMCYDFTRESSVFFFLRYGVVRL